MRHYRDALDVLKRIQDCTKSLMELEAGDASASEARQALQKQIEGLYEGLEATSSLSAAAAKIQRLLAVEEDPETALSELTYAGLKRRLSDVGG